MNDFEAFTGLDGHPVTRREPDEELISQLTLGCVYKPRRWSGDTGGIGGPIDEEETDLLMMRAAEHIKELKSQLHELHDTEFKAGYKAGYLDADNGLDNRFPVD